MTDVDYEKYIERKKAREEGLAEGREEGRLAGRAEAKKETAKNLKNLGMAVSVIGEAVGLSEEEVVGL